MKLSTDPRLPIFGGNGYDKALYQRLYDIFRELTASVNSDKDDIESSAKLIAANILSIETNAESIEKNRRGDPALRFKAAPSEDDDDVVVRSEAFGLGQTLQDVKASRAPVTTYTNSTGKPIFVYLSITGNTIGTGILRINGLDVYGSTVVQPGYACGMQFVVPNGATYWVAMDAGTTTVHQWLEYR